MKWDIIGQIAAILISLIAIGLNVIVIINDRRSEKQIMEIKNANHTSAEISKGNHRRVYSRIASTKR